MGAFVGWVVYSPFLILRGDEEIVCAELDELAQSQTCVSLLRASSNDLVARRNLAFCAGRAFALGHSCL